MNAKNAKLKVTDIFPRKEINREKRTGKTIGRIAVLLLSLIFLFSLSACGKSAKPAKTDASEQTVDKTEKLHIVATIFPAYDWVKQVLGNQASAIDLTLLLDNGVDLHSYRPSAEDISKIGESDLFIYVGGESDQWVDDALKNASNKNMHVINLMDVLGDKAEEEEIIEGMQPAAEEEEEEEGDAPEYDEHVWLSLKNASLFTDAIEKELASLDAAHASAYAANAKAYKEKLQAADQEYAAFFTEKEKALGDDPVLLFGDRFPFRYMIEDYDLDYYAAFIGCSAETEASFETVTFLAKKVDALGLKTVFTIENSDQKIAKTIIENTKAKDQKILVLDSMQSVTGESVQNGIDYLSIMRKNLDTLKQM